MANNVLSARQTFELFKWIEENREYARKTIARKVAQAATEAIGFSITESNVSKARQDLGLTIDIYESRSKPAASSVAILAEEIISICNQLGISVSEEIACIARGKK